MENRQSAHRTTEKPPWLSKFYTFMYISHLYIFPILYNKTNPQKQYPLEKLISHPETGRIDFSPLLNNSQQQRILSSFLTLSLLLLLLLVTYFLFCFPFILPNYIKNPFWSFLTNHNQMKCVSA